MGQDIVERGKIDQVYKNYKGVGGIFDGVQVFGNK